MPGIDDGAKTEEESLALIGTLAEMGIRDIITTPHILGSVWPNEPEEIKEKGKSLLEKIEEAGLGVRFRWAAEYMLDERFMQLLREGELIPLKDDYLLVEISYFNPPINLYDMLYEIQLKGYQPVLAHPERYGFYHRDFTAYEKLKNHGCLFQLNLNSLTGHYGQSVRKTALHLVKEELVDFTGTDLHHSGHIDLMQKVCTSRHQRLLGKIMEHNTRIFT